MDRHQSADLRAAIAKGYFRDRVSKMASSLDPFRARKNLQATHLRKPMTRNKSNQRFAVLLALAAMAFSASNAVSSAEHCLSPFDPAQVVLRGTIVTMDDQHTVIEQGSVLVRNDRII